MSMTNKKADMKFVFPFFMFLLAGTRVCAHSVYSQPPLVLNTWPFKIAAAKGYQTLVDGKTPVDAVVAGCSMCEEYGACSDSVGYGGSPDEKGRTTLDAMVMDGDTMDVGGVGGLEGIREAIKVAREVMERSIHTLLVGAAATSFAKEMGYVEREMNSTAGDKQHDDWIANRCQPNFRRNVVPDPRESCGPYHLPPGNLYPVRAERGESHSFPNDNNHDTIAMIAIATNGVATGTSTNGARFKVPGRVGDSPIAGAGSFAESSVGGCGGTGDGDIMMRFAPCALVIEMMRNGVAPDSATETVLRRMAKFYPKFKGSLIAATKDGLHGAAAWGWDFSYAYESADSEGPQVVKVPALDRRIRKWGSDDHQKLSEHQQLK